MSEKTKYEKKDDGWHVCYSNTANDTSLRISLSPFSTKEEAEAELDKCKTIICRKKETTSYASHALATAITLAILVLFLVGLIASLI